MENHLKTLLATLGFAVLLCASPVIAQSEGEQSSIGNIGLGEPDPGDPNGGGQSQIGNVGGWGNTDPGEPDPSDPNGGGGSQIGIVQDDTQKGKNKGKKGKSKKNGKHNK